MKEVDLLLIKLFDISYQKKQVVISQRYEKAASLRDKERHYEERIYECLVGKKEEVLKWEKYENAIDEYCIKEYGLSYKGNINDNQLKRQIKLKYLGI